MFYQTNHFLFCSISLFSFLSPCSQLTALHTSHLFILSPHPHPYFVAMFQNCHLPFLSTVSFLSTPIFSSSFLPLVTLSLSTSLPLSSIPSSFSLYVSFRCNVQDYIWHKGARCESVVTEFQVMCLAVGASALVVLLLFMIIVCFAKKLHVLKTENKKLRKRR